MAQVVTEVTGKRQLTDKGNRIEAKGEGDFERFVPETFRPLLAGQTTFDFAGNDRRRRAPSIIEARLAAIAGADCDRQRRDRHLGGQRFLAGGRRARRAGNA